KRLDVVWNGIPLDRFQSARGYRKEDVIGVDAPLVLSVGRLERQKDMQTLVRAVAELKGVHLAIAGEGPERADLQALIDREGMRERVHLLGRRVDIPQLLKTADVYAQSSLWEGLDRKSTRLNSSHVKNLVCRLLLEKKKRIKFKLRNKYSHNYIKLKSWLLYIFTSHINKIFINLVFLDIKVTNLI